MKLNLKSLMKNLLENKMVLYVMFFLALTTVFGYFMSNNCSAVLFFILLALLTNYFSKNMIVILGSAIVGTHLLAVLNMFGSRREGFKEGKTQDDDATSSDPEATSSDPEATPAHLEATSTDLDATSTDLDATSSKSPGKATSTKSGSSPGEATSSGVSDKGESFTNVNQKLSPEEILPSKEQLLSKGDKAKAKEKAYDLLESTIGKDNLKGIASDTQVLLKKQTELMDELKNVTPMLSQAMGMVNNLDLNNLTGMFDKLTDMMPKGETGSA